MKLYTKPIKVCNLDYEVVNEEVIIHDDLSIDGHILPSNTTIRVRSNMSLPYYKQALMHETVHAILLAFCLDFIEEEQLERFVDCMASGFLTVMRDNPSLVEFFMEEK